ncbi:unnamed protein product [Aphanomyces euteiches]
MLSKILGDKPGPMVPKSKIHPTIQVETRTIVKLQEIGIDIDVARVLCLNQRAMEKNMENPSTVVKKNDEWVHGGCLMTTDDIQRKVAEREANKRAKQEQIKKNKILAAQKRETAAKHKRKAEERRRESKERKLMLGEDKKPEKKYRKRRQSELETQCSAINGSHLDLMGLRSRLCPIYKNNYHSSFIPRHMQYMRDILKTWFDTYGLDRLHKFLAFSKKFQLIMVQYAVYFGQLDLAASLHTKLDLCTFQEPLVDLAALNGQCEMVKFLRSVGHSGETSLGVMWAAKFGHLSTLIDLMEHMTEDEFARMTAAKLAKRSSHAKIVQYLLRYQAIVSHPRM